MDKKTVNLSVTSHVGRDLLQSAALFKHEYLVAWEYVSNGLQYVDPGVSPFVTMSIDQGQRSIKFKDNGRGMCPSPLKLGHYTGLEMGTEDGSEAVF